MIIIFLVLFIYNLFSFKEFNLVPHNNKFRGSVIRDYFSADPRLPSQLTSALSIASCCRLQLAGVSTYNWCHDCVVVESSWAIFPLETLPANLSVV